MSTPRKRFWNNITAISTLLILGAGFIALFADIDYFYLIWILGFAVIVPIVAILFEDEGAHGFRDFWHDIDEFQLDMGLSDHTRRLDMGLSDHTRRRQRERTRTHQGKRETTEQSHSTQDALSTLRERYANGDLTDTQFEQKLDRLLETETPENATEWRERTMREVETERSE